jgi:hypothetical protein
VDARAWTSGDGPKAIFNDALAWLAKRHVLLPGVTTLARMVARVRDQATERLYETLYHLTDDTQRRLLESAVEVRKGARSDLERWRKAPAEPSGRSLERALERVGEIKALGLSSLYLDAAVPHRRVVELARYGMAAYVPRLRLHARTDRDQVGGDIESVCHDEGDKQGAQDGSAGPTEPLDGQLAEPGAGGQSRTVTYLLDRHHQRPGEQGGPEQRQAVLGPGLGVGGDARRVVVGRPGHQPRVPWPGGTGARAASPSPV